LRQVAALGYLNKNHSQISVFINDPMNRVVITTFQAKNTEERDCVPGPGLLFRTLIQSALLPVY